MKKTSLSFPLAASAALLGACAAGGGMYSQPYAQFAAEQRSPTQDTRPAYVLKVDDTNFTINSTDPVPPGRHTLELSIPGPPGMGDSDRDTMVVDLKPCTLYYFAARRSSPTARDWKAFVAASEPIGECVKRFPDAK